MKIEEKMEKKRSIGRNVRGLVKGSVRKLFKGSFCFRFVTRSYEGSFGKKIDKSRWHFGANFGSL